MSFSVLGRLFALAKLWGDWAPQDGVGRTIMRTPFAKGLACATAWSQSLKTSRCLPTITPFANPNAVRERIRSVLRTPFAIGSAFATAWSQSLKTNRGLPTITLIANPNAVRERLRSLLRTVAGCLGE